MDKWAYENGVEFDFSRPGKPTDNATVESFNGRLRQECLNEHWFMSLEDAKDKIEAWRRYYNETRPHSALDWLTPKEFARQAGLKPRLSSNQEPEFLTSERQGNWVRVKAPKDWQEQRHVHEEQFSPPAPEASEYFQQNGVLRLR